MGIRSGIIQRRRRRGRAKASSRATAVPVLVAGTRNTKRGTVVRVSDDRATSYNEGAFPSKGVM